MGSVVKADFGAGPTWRKGQESYFSSQWNTVEYGGQELKRSIRTGGMEGLSRPNKRQMRHRILRTFHARLVEFKFSQEARVSTGAFHTGHLLVFRKIQFPSRVWNVYLHVIKA